MNFVCLLLLVAVVEQLTAARDVAASRQKRGSFFIALINFQVRCVDSDYSTMVTVVPIRVLSKTVSTTL